MKSTMTLQVPTDTLLAWTDLYIRRPEDKQFKPACRLRHEIAEQGKRLRAATQSITPVIADATTLALIAALQAQTQTNAPVPAPAPPAQTTPPPPRDTTPGEGWTLPERRKFRFRLEDVAY
jgi:hypothetical protein